MSLCPLRASTNAARPHLDERNYEQSSTLQAKSADELLCSGHQPFCPDEGCQTRSCGAQPSTFLPISGVDVHIEVLSLYALRAQPSQKLPNQIWTCYTILTCPVTILLMSRYAVVISPTSQHPAGMCQQSKGRYYYCVHEGHCLDQGCQTSSGIVRTG